MNPDRLVFPDDLYYDRKHGWASVDNNIGIVTQGLTDFGQLIAGNIIFIELPIIGQEMVQGKNLLSIESGKWVGRLPAIMSGKIIAINEDLRRKPSLINDSPYKNGWFVKMEIYNKQEILKLMTSETYQLNDFIKNEIEKYKNIFD